MVRFLILRHGVSVGNEKGVFSGQVDVPLSKTGLRQAEDAADYILKNYKVDAIYSSDLSRAVSTVSPVSERLGIPIIKEKAFREVDTGVWCDVPVDKVKADYPKEYDAYASWDEYAPLGGAENFFEVKMRAKKALEELAKKHDGQTVLIGAHGGIVISLGAHYLGLSYKEFRLSKKVTNASLTVIEFDGAQGKVVELARCDYLKDYRQISEV